MTELLIDPHIRVWVFLPIVLITFFVGVIRHYVSVLISSQKKAEITQIQDSQAMIRARLLRENGKYLTAHSFAMRKNFFNHEETGYFKTQKRAPVAQNSTAMLTDMVKGNFINVLPMVIIGGWINWMFSGFVTTKVPFPLTLRFKPMLQRGVELASLDAAWVSSASWYFLNVFGLRSIYTLVLGENNQADQTQAQADAMTGAAMTMPQDPKAAFKAEWEALEITEYHSALKNVEKDLLHYAFGGEISLENSVRQ
ncbi:PREDICTED: ER membrane protein complex subunit 3 [Rhagoletis zephyria]|uniref:ER membrane protein complex subunit 3 n=1 Tax=Rhagoletis zephyria TaxID=28612 RepID=UPI000811809F|nr:PREDICTED: ER membrane protein complex subunit 3 [Rhagoletis zephyria]XP_036329202.1 ER membrane protein complex subunit 3 [Rhagoletis pomonella]XP_036329203.1 ER membrane protein complex subunit 3 [Rhagoletis pomonella]XP_036329204.1 ER membrane protein complex subunit 3 [Rhagoletis pomonella]